MRRFTILGLMWLVLGVAVASLRNADDYWAGGLMPATTLLIGVVTIGAVYHAGRQPAGRLGFAVFGRQSVRPKPNGPQISRILSLTKSFQFEPERRGSLHTARQLRPLCSRLIASK